MNWLFFAVCGILLLAAIVGYLMGFCRMLLSMMSLVIAIAIVWVTAPAVQKLVIEHTPVQKTLSHHLSETVFNEIGSDEEIEQKINELPLPPSIKQSIRDRLAAPPENVSKKEALSLMTANVIIGMATAVLLFILVEILLWVLGKILDLINRLPGLKQVNGLFGALLGAIIAFVAVEIFFLVILGFAGTSFGTYMVDLIEEDQILSWLYHENPLIYFFNLAKESLMNARALNG